MAGIALPFGSPAAAPAPSAGPAAPGGLIGGALNFNPGALNDYGSQYASAVGMNQTNYNNILAGYQQTMQQQQGAQQDIRNKYAGLSNAVLGGIEGIGQSQQQAINDSYAQQQGQATQGLVNAGLGNTTVTSSVNRGLQLDNQKANIALANQIAGLKAGYQSNIGLADLNYANQANMQNTGLAGQQLGFMTSVMAGYPNAQQFGQLAQQGGAAQQQRAAQAAFDANTARQQGGSGGLPPSASQGGGGAGAGYVPGTGHFANGGGEYSLFGGSPNSALTAPGAYNWNAPTGYGGYPATPQYEADYSNAFPQLEADYSYATPQSEADYGSYNDYSGDYGGYGGYEESDLNYADSSFDNFDPWSYF